MRDLQRCSFCVISIVHLTYLTLFMTVGEPVVMGIGGPEPSQPNDDSPVPMPNRS